MRRRGTHYYYEARRHISHGKLPFGSYYTNARSRQRERRYTHTIIIDVILDLFLCKNNELYIVLIHLK